MQNGKSNIEGSIYVKTAKEILKKSYLPVQQVPFQSESV